MKKYYFFIGTTAELIKVFSVIKEFQDNSVDFKIISSGQNNIVNGEFCNFLNKQPDFVLSKGINKKTPLNLFFWFFKTLFFGIKNLKNEFAGLNKNETYLIVHGDTVSTLMGAIIAKIFRLKLVHIEAGLRSFNFFKPFPEEIDRVLTSNFVDIAFCPNEWALKNLESKKSVKINTKYNTVVDSISMTLKLHSTGDIFEKIKDTNFFIFVLHRQENLLDYNLCKELIKTVLNNSNDLKCLFILHELTRQALNDFGLLDMILKSENIICVDRLNYVDMIHVLNSCEFILGDGGSQQEECYYLGKPCCILRNETERIEGIGENAIISKNNFEIINNFIKEYKKYNRPKITFEESPSKIIFNILTNGK